MKSKFLFILLLLFLSCQKGLAQKKLTVIDMDTLYPIEGTSVLGRNISLQTDSLGHVAVPDSCQSLLFSHINYEERLLNLNEVRDTVFLVSKDFSLNEVVVFGIGSRKDNLKELNKQLRMQKTEAQLMAADPSSGGNLLPLLARLIPKRWLKNSKKSRHERLKQILEKY